MKTETKIKIPEFRGKLLIPSDIRFDEADFLRGDFGKAVDEEVKGRYDGFNSVIVTKYQDGVVKGSNVFYVIAVNEVIRPEGLGTATPADLERVLRTEALDLRGFYEDSAFVLRTEDGTNSYLARNLAEQIRAINKKIKLPVAIPLAELELVKDQDSSYRLSFKLRDDAEIIDASILSQKSSFSKTNEETGLPNKLGEGNRYSYTRPDGLSGLSLDGLLGLYSRDVDLAYSSDDGRVVVVSGEATSKKFLAGYVAQRKALKERYTKELRALRDNIDNELRGE